MFDLCYGMRRTEKKVEEYVYRTKTITSRSDFIKQSKQPIQLAFTSFDYIID